MYNPGIFDSDYPGRAVYVGPRLLQALPIGSRAPRGPGRLRRTAPSHDPRGKGNSGVGRGPGSSCHFRCSGRTFGDDGCAGCHSRLGRYSRHSSLGRHSRLGQH